jgi:hypothetical protein
MVTSTCFLDVRPAISSAIFGFLLPFSCIVKMDGYYPSIHIVVLFRPRADFEAQLRLEHGSCPYLACPLANAFGKLDLTIKTITSFSR